MKAIAIVALIVTGTSYAQCECRPAAHGVVTVDWDRIVKETRAMQSFLTDWTAKKTALQQKARSIEVEISSLENQKQEQSASSIKAQIGALEVRLQKLLSSSKEELDTEYQNAVRTLRSNATRVIAQYVATCKINLVLHKAQVIYNSPEVDITECILSKLTYRQTR